MVFLYTMKNFCLIASDWPSLGSEFLNTGISFHNAQTDVAPKGEALGQKNNF